MILSHRGQPDKVSAIRTSSSCGNFPPTLRTTIAGGPNIVPASPTQPPPLPSPPPPPTPKPHHRKHQKQTSHNPQMNPVGNRFSRINPLPSCQLGFRQRILPPRLNPPRRRR